MLYSTHTSHVVTISLMLFSLHIVIHNKFTIVANVLLYGRSCYCQSVSRGCVWCVCHAIVSVCALITCSPSSRGLFSIAMEQDVGAVNGLAVFSAELALALPNIVSNSLQT